MQDGEFVGRTAVVTGGAAGIGRGVAVALARSGANVVVGDIDRDGLREVESELAGEGPAPLVVQMDATASADSQRLMGEAEDAFGSVHMLITAAGGFPARVSAEDITDRQWEQGLHLNLSSTFYICRAAIPGFKAARSGRIVTVSSAAGRSPSNPTTAYYAAAKAGLIGLTRQLAHELGPFGVTVNAVAPGVTLTPRIATLYDDDGLERLRSITPLNRIAEVEDQVSPILFLLSDGARHITGATLDVNGGRLML
jgi:NAD(P)-dependent dehydrogenase (short-subunit alcohol dehydrogenase family)